MHRDDLISVVEVLHHINGREQLHIVRLQNPMQSNEMGIKIFGTTAPYQGTFEQKSLLEKLENGGTLFIQNMNISMEKAKSIC